MEEKICWRHRVTAPIVRSKFHVQDQRCLAQDEFKHYVPMAVTYSITLLLLAAFAIFPSVTMRVYIWSAVKCLLSDVGFPVYFLVGSS